MPTTRYRLNTGDVGELARKLDEVLGGAWAPRRDGIVEATRTFAYHGGYALVAGVVTLIPDGTIVCTDDDTVYVQRDAEGTVSMGPFDPALFAMAEVTCLAGELTYFQDVRDLAFLMSGGSGVPAGGATGEVLTKLSGADGDADWVVPSGGGGGGSFDAGDLAALTWLNQDSATATLVEGFIVLTEVDHNSEVHALMRAIATPSGDWTVRTRVTLGMLPNRERLAGLLLREASSGKLVQLAPFYTAGSPGEGVYALRWNSPTSFGAVLGTSLNVGSLGPLLGAMILQIRKVGSTLYFEVCLGDGAVFWLVHSEGIAASFTTAPDEYGLSTFCGAASGTHPAAFTSLTQS